MIYSWNSNTRPYEMVVLMMHVERGDTCSLSQKHRIYHRSAMLTEKSKPEGKRIMPETRFTEFPALSVGPRGGISRSASETND